MKKTTMPFKKKKKKSIPPEIIMDVSIWERLPPEIITNHVLSRLPVKSLCRFKFVCSSWNEIISSDQFSKTHLHITNITNKLQKTLLISTSEDALYSVDFADANPTPRNLDYPFLEHSREWIQVSGSCNGLVLINDEGNSNVLFNPFTSECRKLPPSPFFDQCSEIGDECILRGLGYDSSTDNYKVVIICYRRFDDDGDISSFAVYSLETDDWGIVQFKHHDYPPQLSNGFYFNDSLHWLCSASSPMMVAAFDLSRESLWEIQLPASLENREITDFEDHCMAVLGGSLCLVVPYPYPNKGTEVWMMKKYGLSESWTRIVNTRMSIEHVYCLLGEDEGVLQIYGKIVDVDGEMVDCKDKLVLYNLKKETLRVMIVSGIRTVYKITHNYIETLVSPKSRRTGSETL